MATVGVRVLIHTPPSLCDDVISVTSGVHCRLLTGRPLSEVITASPRPGDVFYPITDPGCMNLPDVKSLRCAVKKNQLNDGHGLWSIKAVHT